MEGASEIITKLLTDKKGAERRIMTQLVYVNKTHSTPIVVEKLSQIYGGLTLL